MIEDGKPVIIGMQSFSIGVRKENGSLLLSCMAPNGDGRLVDFWKPRHAAFDPASALEALVVSWPEIAGPFCDDGMDEGTFDLASMIHGGSGAAVFSRQGVYATVTANGGVCALEEHTVVAVEVLLGLGDLLAGEIADENLRNSWKAVRQRTDLFPFEGMVDMESEADLEAESEWYAQKLGVAPSSYRSAARWLHARQTLYGVTGEGSDIAYAEWKPTNLPAGMPPEGEIDALVERAAAAVGETPTEFGRTALYSRNSDARQIVVYGKWYGGGDRVTDALSSL